MRVSGVVAWSALVGVGIGGFVERAEGHPRPSSVAAVVAASGGTFDTNAHDYDILLNAVQTAGLVDSLSDPSATLTVFAPNDAAFIRTARDLGFSGSGESEAWQFLVTALTGLGNGDPVPVLTNILLYHVSGQAISFRGLRQFEWLDQGVPTLLVVDGVAARVRTFQGELVEAEVDFENPRIVGPANIFTGNGVVHTINRVLLPINLPGGSSPLDADPTPGTIGALVARSGGAFDAENTDFDILLVALDAAGLVDDVSTLRTHLTVFAPTDAAFIRTARDLGFAGTDEAGAWQFLVTAFTGLGGGDPIPVLTNVLLYHVVGRELDASDIRRIARRGGSVETLLSGASVRPQRNGTIRDNDPQLSDPRLVQTNIHARNGIVHAIDRVLIPLDLP